MLRSCNGKNVRFRGAVYDRWVFAQLVSFYEKRLVPMGVVVESVFEDIGSGDKEKTWVVQRGTSSLEVSVSQAAGEVSVTVSTDRAAHHWNITPSRGQPPPIAAHARYRCGSCAVTGSPPGGPGASFGIFARFRASSARVTSFEHVGSTTSGRCRLRAAARCGRHE